MKSFKFGMILAMGLSTFVATGCDDDDDDTAGTDTEDTSGDTTDETTTGGDTTDETTTGGDTTDTGTTEPEEISAGPIEVKAFTGGTGKGLAFNPSKIDSEEGPYSVADYTYNAGEISGGAAIAFASVGGKLYYWAGIDGITIDGKEISKKDSQLGNEELVAEGEFEVIAGGYSHTLKVEDLTGTTATVTITLGDKQ